MRNFKHMLLRKSMLEYKYLLNGECQLFNCPCKGEECKAFSECNSCRVRASSHNDADFKRGLNHEQTISE